MRLSNKAVDLELAPLSEMVENHCCRSTKNVNYHNILLSIVSMIKPGLYYSSDLKRTAV